MCHCGRSEQDIDGGPPLVLTCSARQPDFGFPDEQMSIGRREQQGAVLERIAVAREAHRKTRLGGEHLGQVWTSGRGTVNHGKQRRRKLRSEPRDEALKRSDTTRRCPDDDDVSAGHE
jgi:hypothetical protein